MHEACLTGGSSWVANPNVVGLFGLNCFTGPALRCVPVGDKTSHLVTRQPRRSRAAQQPAMAVAVAASLSTPAPSPAAGGRGRRRVNVAVASLRRAAAGGGSSWRSERRLMSELERTVTPGAAERVIRSYVASKSERAALAALSRLLMDSDPFAIPVRVRRA